MFSCLWGKKYSYNISDFKVNGDAGQPTQPRTPRIIPVTLPVPKPQVPSNEDRPVSPASESPVNQISTNGSIPNQGISNGSSSITAEVKSPEKPILEQPVTEQAKLEDAEPKSQTNTSEGEAVKSEEPTLEQHVAARHQEPSKGPNESDITSEPPILQQANLEDYQSSKALPEDAATPEDTPSEKVDEEKSEDHVETEIRKPESTKPQAPSPRKKNAPSIPTPNSDEVQQAKAPSTGEETGLSPQMHKEDHHTTSVDNQKDLRHVSDEDSAQNNEDAKSNSSFINQEISSSAQIQGSTMSSVEESSLSNGPEYSDSFLGRSEPPPPPSPVKKSPKKRPSAESSKIERRPGVVPLPVQYDENSSEPIPKHPKDPADTRLIREAIERNEFLNQVLKGRLLDEVVDAMYNREINSKEIIIKEGERGSHLFVSAKGKYEVSAKGKGVLAVFDDVRVFGELAILYNDRRLATVKAVKSGRVWVLDRAIYQRLRVERNIKEQDEMVNFLQNVPTLNTVGLNVLQKVANLLKMEFFQPGAVIVRQGDRGDTFYIIRAGTVTISKEGEGIVGKCKRGQYFGEHALLAEDCRQATVTADPPGVECLTLQRQHFIDHFGEVSDISTITVRSPKAKTSLREPLSEHGDIELSELCIRSTLGVGGFGRVELVQHLQKPSLVFALKYLKKIDMVEQNQQEHVKNEKTIQMACRSMFIIRLYRTYRDNKYVYFLMESCLGGDLWTLLQRQKNRRFEERDARFIAACVLEAFGYLHERGIVYRDLKPENLLIDKDGYIKLTDFGFAKRLGPRGKTFTFAGTPEYVAPEIVLNRGHDKAVDYWAFGIFIYELLTGRTPFRTNDSSHMRTYNRILAGIDNVEFPPFVSHKARHIIEKLCRPLPTERLGCLRNGIKDVKASRWFMGFDWEKLNNRKLPVPFKPKLKSDIDTQYFEKFKKDDDNPPDEFSGWDDDL